MIFNKAIVYGRVMNEVKIRQTAKGINVCNLIIAIENVKDTVSTVIDATAWADKADVCSKFLKKGSYVLIEGKLQTHTRINKSGEKISKIVIVCQNIQLVRKSSVQYREPNILEFDDDVNPYGQVNQD